MNFFKDHSLATPVNIVIQPREVSGIVSPSVQPSVQPSYFPSPQRVHTTAPPATSTVAVMPTSAPAGSSPTIVPSSDGNKMMASATLLAFFVGALAIMV